MKIKSIKDNNAGFSLIELIVSVLITGILMMAVGLFMSTSRTAYQTVSTSAKLQEEAMTVERVMSEYIKEAQKYGLDEGLVISGTEVDVFWVKAKENEGTSIAPSVYFFVHDKTKKNIRYYKGEEADVEETTGTVTTGGIAHLATGVFGASEKYSLVASNVESMEKKSFVQRADGTDLICLKLTYSYLDKTYSDTLTAVTRNKNRTPSSFEPEPDPGP
ncbi:MAG: prepilin-type N-terminal cleavage/methylation domain-containing protein [Lachnospiraceae bacterium]|nr:prepilin-type N-terminal cleavage/methylation domain-containing protein [Lachnospiraceae bacterium]